tara:strand:- start:3715 stop:3894 length:180 start_codon:yes stop_codon:yes gene_type:complete
MNLKRWPVFIYHYNADKGYDSEAIRDKVRECGSEPVIPIRQNSKQGNDDMMGVYTNIGI